MSELDDLMPSSPDHNATRLAELKRLFPDLFTDEGHLDGKALQKLLNPSTLDMEKYRFTWYGKTRAQRKAFSPSKGALLYDDARSVNPELADGNMIIEGENLEVLKLLTSAYSESVKCIYIDPPYNTGNDFIYPDNYAQSKKEYWEQNGVVKDGVKMDSNPESNGRFHSDWLSMIYSRLLVARLLLKEDGVIFVSIDDNEVHNLRKLMDEVFGEENFIAQIIWQKKYSPQNDATYFSDMHDYLLCYAKTKKQFSSDEYGWQRNLLPRTDVQNARYKNPDNDPRGNWKPADFSVKTYSEAYDYEITTPSGRIVTPPMGRCWSTSPENLQKLIQDNRIWFGKEGNAVPSRKVFLTEVKNGIVPSTLWLREEVGDSEEGRKKLKTIFAEHTPPFDNPKPVRLITRILELTTSMDTNDLFLDFFGGSGTSAQAVVELNAKDKGDRKFILVQLPERIDRENETYKAGYKKISDITIERVKRVIEGHGEKPTLFGKGHKTGFKVYRLAQSRFPRVTFQPDPDKSTAENVAALKQYINEKEASMHLLFERDAVFDELLLKQGFKLTYTLEKQDGFTQNDVFLAQEPRTGRQTFICLDTTLHESTVAHFKTERDIPFICLERALNTDKKWALKHYLGDLLKSL